ncbi:MAG: beta-lactamase family protein [Bdellovibrionales bacterium]|nr:beta-lactamase family protein [Bdellovibrionales bacterium]
MHTVSGFEAFPRAREVFREGLRDGVFPGGVFGVWSRKDPDVFRYGWGGSRRLRLKGLTQQPMELDTVFDLASVTKVFGTGALAMAFVERGWLTWDTPASAILHDFRHAGVTLRQLAAHTSGLPAWYPFFERMREAFSTHELERIAVDERQEVMREIVMGVELERAPGTKAVYSDVGFLVLGFCLEAIAGLPLDRAVERFVWQPMGLYEDPAGGKVRGPFYRRTIEPAFRDRDETVAATEDCPWRRGVLQGQVHDDNTWAMGGYAGHAGAFGDARTLLRFGRALLDGYFSPAVTAEAWTRVSIPEGCDRTPGWDTPSGDSPALGKIFSPRSVGHLGFTGTSFWIDPVNQVVVTLLTNRVHPSRENTLIRAFRGRFHDALARDLSIGI